MLEEGTTLGKYRICHKLGTGGMADVYLAEDLSLGRQVALKVLPPELARDPDRALRFEKEVRAAAQLQHPHIVTVFDVGHDQGLHFYSMAYLPGGDLKQSIQQGLTPQQALEITRQLAEALGYAHTKGFVHRDVKPENILFDDHQRPLLTDLGIAKALGSGTRMTGTGMSIGTPHYMSPEQARGLDVDGRSDLYSLGVVLFEMLTGYVPYDAADSFAIAYAHINNSIPQLPATIGKLQPLIDRLLAKEPAQRLADAGALIAAIDELLSCASVPAADATKAPPTKQKTKEPSSHRSHEPVRTQVINPPEKKKSAAPWIVFAVIVVIAVVGLLTTQPTKQSAGYIDNGNGTVTDTSTGLAWQQTDDERMRNWQEATNYCNTLNLESKGNWRLPSLDELKTLIDESKGPTIDPIFSDTKSSYYWSASSHVNDPTRAWGVLFTVGYVSIFNKASNGYVRCVR